MVLPAAFLSRNVPLVTPWTAALKVAVTLVPAVTAVASAPGVTAVTVGAGATGAGAGAGAAATAAAKSSRLGVPLVAPVITPAVALDTSPAATCAGVRAGFWDSSSAAAPATCGEAIEVPDIEAVAVAEL